MTEEQVESTEEIWRDVGRQFDALGDSLAQAFRAAWESEETRKHMQSIRDSLEAMADKIDRAVEEAAASPQAERWRDEAEKAAESLRAASEKTWRDTRPHLLSAMKQVNVELQKAIERMEQEHQAGEEDPRS